MGFCAKYGIKVDRYIASKIGKAASSIARKRGNHIGQVVHPVYGHVNSYCSEDLKDALSQTIPQHPKITYIKN